MDGWARTLLVALTAGALAGCGSPPPTTSATITLEPYQTDTALPAATAGATIAPLPTTGPSPTPQAYTVHAGDQFLAIALAYGLTREELLAANPDVNPDMLSIGQQLLIPAPGGQGTATPIPTSTPLPLHTAQPRCFRSASGGVTCLVGVTNTTGGPVEGLTGLITLVDRGGNALLTVPAHPPVNMLPAGRTMVLAAFFSPPVPEFERAAAALTLAVPVEDVGARYAGLEPAILRSAPGTDRLSWAVDFEVRMPAGSSTRWRLAAALLAFDEQGDVIGYSKWEAGESLRPGEQASAAVTVYSLGPAIERVEVLAEAMPPQ